MKSRQFIWLLLFSTALNLNSFGFNSVKSHEDNTFKKVFILLRSEDNTFQLQQLKKQINTSLLHQNVSAKIETYKRTEPLPQAKIFKKAYSENYDVILLIDQVAKYKIDNRVTNTMIKVGGKYRIKSYNLKTSPYTWKDHGDSNCNLSVEKSVKYFTSKILKSIDIEPIDKEIPFLDNRDHIVNTYDRLLKELEAQKKKTNKLLREIMILESRLKYRVKNTSFLVDRN